MSLFFLFLSAVCLLEEWGHLWHRMFYILDLSLCWCLTCPFIPYISCALVIRFRNLIRFLSHIFDKNSQLVLWISLHQVFGAPVLVMWRVSSGLSWPHFQTAAWEHAVLLWDPASFPTCLASVIQSPPLRHPDCGPKASGKNRCG